MVVELEVSGFLNPRAPPRNTLHALLSDALRKFTSICSVKFTPATYHEDVFTDSLKLLPNFAGSLREVALNASCTSDERSVSLLTGIQGLSKIALYSPGRAILQLLPEWLEKNASTLTELHLFDNCGSVTPGVLKSFLPHVQENLKAFSLGLSYSITDEDLFTFLSQLPNIEHLRLRNYWQMKEPTHKPGLRKLKSFTADYGGGATSFNTCVEVSRFCRWVRRTIAASPIQSLRIIAGDEEQVHGGDDLGIEGGESAPSYYVLPANPAFDSLVEHLVRKHASTLQHLHIRSAFVSLTAIRSLFTHCRALESVHMSVGNTAMDLLSELLPDVPSLHSAAFEIRNIRPRSLKFGEEEALALMQRGPRLRRLAVNGRRWEGSWKVTPEVGKGSHGEVSIFSVEELRPVVPPWRRTNHVAGS